MGEKEFLYLEACESLEFSTRGGCRCSVIENIQDRDQRFVVVKGIKA